MVEYVEDALETGALQLGADGQPLRSYHLADGTEIVQTGDPIIDQMEQEFAERAQRDIRERLARGEPIAPPVTPAKEPEAPWYAEEDLLTGSK